MTNEQIHRELSDLLFFAFEQGGEGATEINGHYVLAQIGAERRITVGNFTTKHIRKAIELIARD